MKIGFVSFSGLLLMMILATSAKAYNWEIQDACHFISADQKKQIDDTCYVEGFSSQGVEFFIVNWKDGVKTKVKGNFVSQSSYTVDGLPAAMRRVNNVTILHTQSGNTIILFKIQSTHP